MYWYELKGAKCFFSVQNTILPVLKTKSVLMSEQAAAAAAPGSGGSPNSQAQTCQPAELLQPQRAAAMQFKGDAEGELRLIEILKAILQYGGKIFEWGNKEKILKEVHEVLNKNGLFGWQLKF